VWGTNVEFSLYAPTQKTTGFSDDVYLSQLGVGPVRPGDDSSKTLASNGEGRTVGTVYILDTIRTLRFHDTPPTPFALSPPTRSPGLLTNFSVSSPRAILYGTDMDQILPHLRRRNVFPLKGCSVLKCELVVGG